MVPRSPDYCRAHAGVGGAGERLERPAPRAAAGCAARPGGLSGRVAGGTGRTPGGVGGHRSQAGRPGACGWLLPRGPAISGRLACAAGGGMAPMASPRYSNSLSKLVGRTGFEPVTFSVSGRRAPAAPTARDDESLPGRARCCATGTGARERASRTFATPPTQASIRGSPNRAMLLLSTNRVTAEIRSPSSVSTIIPCARNTCAWSSCR